MVREKVKDLFFFYIFVFFFLILEKSQKKLYLKKEI